MTGHRSRSSRARPHPQRRWRQAATLALALLTLLLTGAATAQAVVINVEGHRISYVPTKGVTPGAAKGPAQALVSPLPGAAGPIGAACSSGCLTYHSGPVMRSDTIWAVFWQPPGYAHPFTQAYKNLMIQYLQDVAAESGSTTDHYSVAQQYYDTLAGPRTHIGYGVSYGGEIDFTNAYPAATPASPSTSQGCINPPRAGDPCITNYGFFQETMTQLEGNHPLDTNNQYVVFTPSGVDACGDNGPSNCSGVQLCGYHSEFSGPNGTGVYSSIPYDADWPGTCAVGQEPNANPADEAIRVVEHEVVEAATDPGVGTGWTDSTGSEIGDKCNSAFGSPTGTSGAQYNQTVNGHNYFLQQLWDNLSTACQFHTTDTAAPTAALSVPSAVAAGQAVTLNAGSSSAAAGRAIDDYRFGFGDGSPPSALQSAATIGHTYTTAADYSATTTVTDDGGLSATSGATPVHVVGPVQAAFTAPGPGRAGQTLSFSGTGSSDPNGSITAYAWSFGDPGSGAANASTAAQPTHAFAAAGTYTVTLTVTDPAGSQSTISHTVSVQGPPQATFTAPGPGRPAQVLSFNGTGSTDPNGSIATYAWSFGDPGSGAANTSALPQPTHAFAAVGTYSVSLTVTDALGATSTVTHTVTVEGPPQAVFTAPGPGQPGHALSFDGTGSTDPGGAIASYSWNFGETGSASNASSLAQPSHIYAAAGSYTVALTVTDGAGATSTVTHTVSVQGPPQAAFTAPAPGRPGQSLGFDGTTSTDPNGSITAYSWDFGDPSGGGANASTAASPSHAYTASGNYTVALTVTDATGAQSTVTHAVSVQGPPQAAFTAPGPGRPAQALSFSGTASTDPNGSITTYSWSFGDPGSGAANTSALSQPSHSYASAGSYTVGLTVTDAIGAQSTVSHTVVVEGPPQATFTAPGPGQPGQAQAFDATASSDPNGSITAYAWNFGDPTSGASNTSTASKSTHTFATSGTYSVSLTVTDPTGAQSTTSHSVTIEGPPQATFTAPGPGKPAQALAFDGTPSSDPNGTITAYSWDFGDPASGAANTAITAQPSHTYATSGNYTVALTVTDAAGAQSTTSHTVIVEGPPQATFTAPGPGKPAQALAFDGTASTDPNGSITTYSWDFGDPGSGANNTATTAQPSHAYATAGSYTVTLTVTDATGAQSSVSHTVAIEGPPQATFTAPGPGEAGQALAFDGTTSTDPNGTITAYAWNFGDPTSGASNTSTASKPVHTFAAAGAYTVALTVTDATGAQSTTSHTVKVQGPPQAAFTAPGPGKPAQALAFDGTSSTDPNGSITAYSWNFGDPSSAAQNTSTLSQPSHTFAGAGDYTVSLTVTDATGAQSTTSHTVKIQGPPQATFTAPGPGRPAQALSFDGTTSTDANGSITAYAWDFGDPNSGAQNTSGSAQPTHTYGAAGNYVVALTVTDATGAQSTTSRTVTIQGPPQAAFTAPGPGSPGESLAFDGTGSSDANGSVTAYSWDFGDPGSNSANTATTAQPSHTYATAGHYTVSLTVTDATGAQSTTTHVVAVDPVLRAAFTAPGPGRPAQTLAFDGTTSSDPGGSITAYAWDFGDPGSGANNTATTAQPSHTYATAGNYTVTLTVTDATGAQDTTTHTVTVEGPPQAAFAAPGPVEAAHPVGFDATASSDPNGSIATYGWNFGDPASGAQDTSTAAQPSHTYAAPGDYTVTLTVTDALGQSSSASHAVSVQGPPAPAFTASASPAAGAPVTFDGRGSTVPHGTIAAYAWDFGDGSTSASGAGPSHVYTAPGNYTVSLTVTDGAGGVRSVAHALSVAAPAPSPAAGSAGGGSQPAPPAAGTSPPAPAPPGPSTPPGAAAPPLGGTASVPNQRLTMVIRRGLTVALTASAPASAAVQLLLPIALAHTLHLAGAPRATTAGSPYVVIGQGAVMLTGKPGQTVRIKLSRSARTRLRHSRRVRLTVLIRLSDAAGGRADVRAGVMLSR